MIFKKLFKNFLGRAALFAGVMLCCEFPLYGDSFVKQTKKKRRDGISAHKKEASVRELEKLAHSLLSEIQYASKVVDATLQSVRSIVDGSDNCFVQGTDQEREQRLLKVTQAVENAEKRSNELGQLQNFLIHRITK
jgi:hypothetical protein